MLVCVGVIVGVGVRVLVGVGVELAPIVEKLNSVKEETEFDIDKWKHLSKSTTKNPFKSVNPIKFNDDDDLGFPPKIVM